MSWSNAHYRLALVRKTPTAVNCVARYNFYKARRWTVCSMGSEPEYTECLAGYDGVCNQQPKPEHGEARVARRKSPRRIAGSARASACIVLLGYGVIILTHDLARSWIHKV